MRIETITIPAGKDLAAVLRRFDQEPPCFLAMHHRAGALPSGFLEDLHALVPALHAGSSCKGIMSDQGLADVGVFALYDRSGDYGTACEAFGESIAQSAHDATERALSRAGREGEAPDLVWVSCTPGFEEEALAGIEAAVGKHVPIIGGSAADDTIEGAWSVSDGQVNTGHGLAVSVLFSSTPLHFAYQNGYEPTARSGIVTKAEGRHVKEIDNRPATSVYQDWNGGKVPKAHDAAVNILSDATLWPLGRKSGALGSVNAYLLAHPSCSHPDGSIELFAEVAVGEEITQMIGDRSALATRAGRVAAFALQTGKKQPEDIAGALVVYCGGCRMAVEDMLQDVQTGVAIALDGSPFLGVFTFGEQGPLHGQGNCHGNLMISCITFGKET